MVNHSDNFVDPYTAAHTNTIELIWNAVKKKLNGGINDQFCVQQSCTLFPWEWWFNNRGPITLLLNRPIRPGVPFNLQQRKLRPPLCGGVSTIMWFFKSSHSHSFIIVSCPHRRSSGCNRLHESKDDWEWFVGQHHHHHHHHHHRDHNI